MTLATTAMGRSNILKHVHVRYVTQVPSRHLSSYVVTPQELQDALSKNNSAAKPTSPRTIPICATWYMPNEPSQRTGYLMFKRQRIPGARFFDLDAVKDHESPYPHMLPEPEEFAEAMGELGIRKDDAVVVYDSAELGLFSAPRASWTFRAFGHERVHILNNFRLWVQQGYPLESGEPARIEETTYPLPPLDPSKVAEFDEVKELAMKHRRAPHDVQILDARSHTRWSGQEQEPRPGLPAGHIPGSISVPFAGLLDPETKALLPREELRKVFKQRGVDPDKPIITSCGTGVTAAVLDAALEVAGIGRGGNRKLYDGSWTEWAQRVGEDENLVQKGNS